MIFAAERALVGDQLVGPTSVELAHGVITAVRPHVAGDPPARAGLLMPGLVNAHAHLELSYAWREVPGGQGFSPWVRSLFAVERPADTTAMQAAVASLVTNGTAAISDICNGPSTAPTLAAHGVGGIVQREIFGLTPAAQQRLLARACEPAVVHEGPVALVERSSPHAMYSMHADVLAATITADGHGRPASLHVAEDASHLEFLAHKTGPMAKQCDDFGVDWRGWEALSAGPVATLAARDLLGPHLMLVHGNLLTPDERTLVRERNVSLVLCPRSNMHIGGRLPPADVFLTEGLRLALGTDSLASNDDLDVLGEVRVLHEAFPDVPLGTWLAMATRGGAQALVDPALGVLEVGRSPGLILVHPARPWEEREVLARAGRNHV